MTLRELKIGESAVVTAVGGEGALRQHFLDMGLLPGVEVKLLKFAPMGDPMELLVRGYTLSLRLEEAAKIQIEKGAADSQKVAQNTEQVDFGYNLALHEHNSHPGLGEAGKYHDPTHENALPKGMNMVIRHLWKEFKKLKLSTKTIKSLLNFYTQEKPWK